MARLKLQWRIFENCDGVTGNYVLCEPDTELWQLREVSEARRMRAQVFSGYVTASLRI